MLQLLDQRSPAERDWRDPDNVMFTPRDEFKTLADCGFAHGCALSLHSLGPATPKKEDPVSVSTSDGAGPSTAGGSHSSPTPSLLLSEGCTSHTLSTPIPPSRADHSFCGVLFDVHAKSEAALVVTSIWVGGMLGRVRVFARPCSWKGPVEGDVESRTVHTGWGARYDIDTSLWAQVADETCQPSWDVAREIKLAVPVTVRPHHTVGLFVHSALPDDLGIQYQTYNRQAPFAEDAHVALLPGLGFTGAVPFDSRHGWNRLNRGMSGRLTYFAVPCHWSLAQHATFPASLRSAVKTLLLSQHQKGSTLQALPAHVIVQHILPRMHWDWAVPEGAQPPPGGFTEEGGGDPKERARLLGHFFNGDEPGEPEAAFAYGGSDEDDDAEEVDDSEDSDDDIW